MRVEIFKDDDTAYSAWLTEHATGWVVNATRRPTPAYLKLHHASCSTISQLRAGYSRWTTGAYIKLCAEQRADLEHWAQATLRTSLQDGCRCVHRGAAARPGREPRRHDVPATVPAPAAVDDDGFATIAAPAMISFEPRDAAVLAARAAIRGVLGAMAAQPGELLHGIVEGHGAAGTDLDNALLYNIGGRVAGATRHGVVLERRATTAGSRGTLYRYRLTRDAGIVRSRQGRAAVELTDVQLGRPPTHWSEVWEAVRTSPSVRVLAHAPVGALALHLRIGAPRFGGAANGGFVKTLVDGVLTALHAHSDTGSAGEIGRRMGARLTRSPAEIAALVLGQDRAVLGSLPRLVVLRDRGVQCLPKDDRLAALQVEIDRSAVAWSLSGRLSLCRD